MKFLISVITYDDYIEGLSQAIVDIDLEFIARLKELLKAVKSVNADSILVYNTLPQFVVDVEDPDALDPVSSDVRVECLDLVVDKYGDFRWDGLIKYSDAHFSTDELKIEEISKQIKKRMDKEDEYPEKSGTAQKASK